MEPPFNYAVLRQDGELWHSVYANGDLAGCRAEAEKLAMADPRGVFAVVQYVNHVQQGVMAKWAK